MMKKIIIKLVKVSIVFISYFFSPRISKVVSVRFNQLYSLWKTQELNRFGNKSLISYPIDLKGGKYIVVGKHVTIGKNSVINAWDKYLDESYTPSIIIGDSTHLGEGCHLSATTKILIGNNVLTGRQVSIIDNSHGESSIKDFEKSPAKRKLSSKGSIIIEDNVWIGDKVTILSGITIGTNSIIGANSVVTKNVPANSVAAGIPAKILKAVK